MNIGNRIKSRRKELHLSADEVAEKLNVSRSTVFRYENGDIEKFPTQKLTEIANVLKTTPGYLMGWSEKHNYSIVTLYNKLDPNRQDKVYNYASDQLKDQQSKDGKIMELFPEEKQQFPFYGAVSAGTGEFVYDDNTSDYIDIEPSKIPSTSDFCLKVNGDSMEPVFQNGHYVFVEKQNELNDGAIGVVIVNGESFLKRVWFSDYRARLESFNKKYPDKIITQDDDFRIVGKVVL